MVYANNTTSGNRLFIQDLNAADAELVEVAADEDADVNVIFSKDGEIFAETNRAAQQPPG